MFKDYWNKIAGLLLNLIDVPLIQHLKGCRFGVETTVRPSLSFYNTCAEIDRMVGVLQHLSSRS